MIEALKGSVEAGAKENKRSVDKILGKVEEMSEEIPLLRHRVNKLEQYNADNAVSSNFKFNAVVSIVSTIITLGTLAVMIIK